MKTMFVIIFLFFSMQKANAQVYNEKDFIHYNEFKHDLNNGLTLSSLSAYYKFQYLLLLDPAFKIDIFNFNSELELKYYQYLNASKVNDRTTGFVTDATNLKTILKSTNFQKKIVQCALGDLFQKSVNWEISYPIYIKDNSAICTVISHFSSDILHVTLAKGVVQINLLESYIE